MKIFTFIVMTAVFLCLAVFSFGQAEVSSAQLNINNVNAMIRPVGNQFNDFNGNRGYEVPVGGGVHSIFNSTLWVGGKDANNALHLSAERYRQIGIDYYTGPLTTDGFASIDALTVEAWNRIWTVDRTEIDNFILCNNNPDYPDYTIPTSILDWPAHGDISLGQSHDLAPYVDINSDGEYNPTDGDYPNIRGDRCLFFIFNDNADIHTESGGEALGIEVHGMAYAFNCPDNTAFNNAIFLNYKIINRSTNTYYNTYIGAMTDFDIGNPDDDFIGCDVERGAFYGYNGDGLDESVEGVVGYGSEPPSQATVILGGPYSDPDGFDNTTSYDTINQELVLNCSKGDILNGNINGLNYQDCIVDNERWGMTKFVNYNNCGGGFNPNTIEPFNASDYYGYLNGLWLDNTVISYGGTGHYSGGANMDIPADFMFPGDPTTDNCGWGQGGIPQPAWSEETLENSPTDKKGLGVSGPFTFIPGTSVELDLAFVFGEYDGAKSSSVDVMKQNIDIIRNGFVNNITPSGRPFIYSAIPNNTSTDNFAFSLFPNPANNNLTIEVNPNKNNTVSVQILDLNGRVYMSENLNNNHSGTSRSILDIRSLSAGVYIVSISNGERAQKEKLVILK